MTVKNYKWAIEQTKLKATVARKDWPDYVFVSEEEMLTVEEQVKVDKKFENDPNYELTFEEYESLDKELTAVITKPNFGENPEELILYVHRWEPSEEDLEAVDYEWVAPVFPVPDTYYKEQGQE